MNYIKEYKEYKDIDAICYKYGIENYTINNGVVDVDGDVDLSYKGLTNLPLKFGVVTRYFDCSSNKLISLEGSPREVGGIFNCNNNLLKTLEFAPKYVGGDFNCGSNPLPDEISTYEKYIKEIVKWQDDYNIWRNGKLDSFRFGELIKDIEDDLHKGI